MKIYLKGFQRYERSKLIVPKMLVFSKIKNLNFYLLYIAPEPLELHKWTYISQGPVVQWYEVLLHTTVLLDP